MVFDTGVLVELAADSPSSKALQDDILSGRFQPITSDLNIAELGYILCRKIGSVPAKKSVELLRKSNEIRIFASSGFLDLAAEMKCVRSISLVDCVTLALGEALSLPVLFAKRESELTVEMKKGPFKTKLVFLDELKIADY